MKINSNKTHPSLSIYNNMYVMIYDSINYIVIYKREGPYSYITKFDINREFLDKYKSKERVIWL